MSLFKLREFWSVVGSENENYDQNSLLVTNFNGGSDYVITGSLNGCLRIFKPSSTLLENNSLSGFRPNDVLLEKVFEYPILQLSCGKLASGSMQIHLAILHPLLISVFHLRVEEGITEHGTQNYLELLYEHKLERVSANFIIGPFGNLFNRDFICVQSLDGMLSFFEQECCSFTSFLPDFLLPGPIAYLKKIDCFVTINCNWILVAYKYNQISEMGKKADKKEEESGRNLCEFNINLGEMALDIIDVDGEFILVLGERNIFCFNVDGSLRFMKHLDYSPVCFHGYAKDGDVFSLVVSENSTLFIHQNTSLKWSAKIQTLPVCIKRVFLQNIQGAVVLLSEEGKLDCSYLGTDPNLYIAPPLARKPIDHHKVEQELLNLNKTLQSSEGSQRILQQSTVKPVSLKVSIESILEPCTYPVTMSDRDDIKMAAITIEILPQTALDEVQISFLLPRALKVNPQIHHFSNLMEKTSCVSYAYLYENIDIPSMELCIVATVITNSGIPRSIIEYLHLPLKLVTRVENAVKEAEHKVTLVINQKPVPLAVMFADLIDTNTTDLPTSAIGIKSTNSNDIVTVLLAKSSQRYRIQSNHLTGLSLPIEQIIFRLNQHFRNVDEFKITLGSPLPGHEIVPYIVKHFEIRQEIITIEEDIQKYCWILRQIEKRFIVKLKMKNPTSLVRMELLMKEVFHDLNELARKLETARSQLLKAQNDLACVMSLLKNLISLLDLNQNRKHILSSTFNSVVDELTGQNWEDVMDSSLCYLLRTILAESDKDRLRLAQGNFETVTDVSKIERHFVQVIERINKNKTCETEEISSEEITKEEIATKCVGSQFGELSSRLLSERKTLIVEGNKNDS